MRIISCLLLLSLCWGCTRNRAYRFTVPPGASVAVPEPVAAESLALGLPQGFYEPPGTPQTGTYRLAFIEFDESGELWDRRQLEQACQAIREAKAWAKARQKHAIVEVFIHGWKNNASEGVGNVPGFRSMLAMLALHSDGNPVVGIYIGWRGLTLRLPVLGEFTFWNRSDRAGALPGAHLTGALLGIAAATKGPQFTERDICVFIGHSFGGKVLEHAITQTLIYMSQREKASSPVNLIVLVNEAAPALESTQLLEHYVRLASTPGVPTGYSAPDPLVLSLTSRGDTATKVALPVGSALAWYKANPRRYRTAHTDAGPLGFDSQWPLYFKSTGNTSRLFSHELADGTNPHPDDYVRFRVNADGPYYALRRVAPDPATPWTNRTPYWVMALDKWIVPDHGQIFTAEFQQFLNLILRRRQAKDYTVVPLILNPAEQRPAVATPGKGATP